MESFDDWVRTSTFANVQKWGEKLVELGASWETFQGDFDDIIEDLTSSGIPILAAKNICKLAKEALSRSKVPLSIFWDIENVCIPSDVSGATVATRLKSILEPHGHIKQFRGYASLGLGHIPEDKRSELQLSGCHLVDTPHVGRKDVADKMIIVDAMEWAYSNPEGATLCFITGDIDFAYLLAKLQQRPQWTTIVISKDTMQSMLHVNCDMKMRWETDVLQLRPTPVKPPPPPEFSLAESGSSEHENTGASVFNYANSLDSPPETLTPAEAWADDVELLRSIVANGAFVGGSAPGTLKSHVGNMLRQTNPARFNDRSRVQDFLLNAIEDGVVIETGDGPVKALHLPSSGKIGQVQPPITLSDKAPVTADDLEPKTLQYLEAMPFALFIKKHFIATGTKFSGKGVMIQTSGPYMILMFQTLSQAQQMVASNPALCPGTLVDWRKGARLEGQKTAYEVDASPAVLTVRCASCNSLCAEINLFAETCYDVDRFCRTCFESRDFWTKEEVNKVENRVIELLRMMAANDDVCVPRNILKKALQERWPMYAVSRGQADSWIEGAVGAGIICEMKRSDGKTKAKILCLPENARWAMMPYPPDDTDTSAEEKNVLEWLWESEGCCMSREAVILALEAKFPRMNNPMMRNKMFLNARTKGAFFIAKGASGQMVGLSEKDANDALNTKVHVQSSGEGDSSNGASTGETSVATQEVKMDDAEGGTSIGDCEDAMSSTFGSVSGDSNEDDLELIIGAAKKDSQSKSTCDT